MTSTQCPAYRSVLLSTGADAETLRVNAACDADVLCIDLEDTVTDKDAARHLAAAFHTDPGPHSGARGIRMNPLSEEDGLRDVLMLRSASWKPDLVVLTKVLHPHEIRLATELLPDCDLIALIETAAAVEHAAEIGRVSPRLKALMFGGKDLALALGSERRWESLLYGRGRVVNAAAASGVPALDENYRPLGDLEGLAEASTRSRAMGFRGRLTIDARHVPIINDLYAA
ncbi:HpcH/HpaI aldolase/citrate lyase family protein [Roseomonas sp. WA12]